VKLVQSDWGIRGEFPDADGRFPERISSDSSPRRRGRIAMGSVARYLPHRVFPPYTYVPGQAPHPIRDPAGHMYGEEPEPPQLLVEEWWNCEEYLWGIDLFNHGYYWEAHEAWEGLWHAAGRTGRVADFLKGLIKLAAAGVKTRGGSLSGRQRHLRRAGELLESVRSNVGGRLMGLDLNTILDTLMDPDSGDSIRQDVDLPSVFHFALHPERMP
jgi:uncharacterized protein